MTRDEFIKLLMDNLKPDAQMDFLVTDRMSDGKSFMAFLKVDDVCMNADIDDPKNKNRGGVVFMIEDELLYR